MSYLIIGASSGLGKSLAYEFAKNKKNLIIVSRHAKDLEAIKNDIKNNFKVKVKAVSLDLSSIDKLKKKMIFNNNFFNKIEGILFPIGQMHELDFVDKLEIKEIKALLSANFLSIAFIVSKYLKFKKNKKGLIIGFGSVSGHLGRKFNPYYSASKRALESFFESLILSNENKKICIQFYILGYLSTNLSFGKKLFLPKGSTKTLSRTVYKNRYSKNRKFYFPFWWRIIINIINYLPFRFIVTCLKILNK